MPADLPDWTRQSQISGGSITATIDTGGGPVQVKVSSGSITATIDTSGGPVSVQATLVANQQVLVQGVAGGTAVGVTGAVSINTSGGPVQVSVGNTVQVQNAPGTNLEVVVNTSGGAVTVQQNGTFNVQFLSAQEIQWTSTGPVSVQDTFVPDNSLVFLGSYVFNVSNLVNGGAMYGGTVNVGSIGLYDGLVYLVNTANNWGDGVGAAYSLGSNGLTIASNKNVNPYGYVFAKGTVPAYPAIYGSGSGTSGSLGPVYFPAPICFSGDEPVLTNISGGTIASDTVTVYLFGIKAQVTVYNTVATNATVTNTTGSPANTQPAQGSYDSLIPLIATSLPNGNVQTKIMNSGGYISYLTLGFSASTVTIVTVWNGSTQIWQGTSDKTCLCDFKGGVPNNGVYAAYGGGAGTSCTVLGYGVGPNTTPNVRVGSIV